MFDTTERSRAAWLDCRDWSQLSARERDAWTAACVTSWTDVDFPKKPAMMTLASLSSAGELVWSPSDYSGIPAGGGGRETVPAYSTDPAKDYAVLVWARSQPPTIRTFFDYAILRILRRYPDDICYAGRYRPGDYAAAAHATIIRQKYGRDATAGATFGTIDYREGPYKYPDALLQVLADCSEDLAADGVISERTCDDLLRFLEASPQLRLPPPTNH